MQCPKCGTENPDEAQICNLCKYTFGSRPDQDMPVEPKISRLAIFCLVLGISSLLFFMLTGIPAIVIGIFSILRIRSSGGKLKGKSFAPAGILISLPLMCIFCLLWSLDAPPIPNDYTIADLRSAPAQYAGSFEVLKTLIDEEHNLPGAPAIGLTKEDFNIIEEISKVISKGTAPEISETLSYYTKDVEQAWAKAEKARDVIGQLNEFTEIADLIEPNLPYNFMRRYNLIKLAHLYQAYAHLQTEQKGIQAVTTDLIELDSVFRKLSLNARPLIGKLICHVCMEADIVTANTIANNPGASQESVEQLAEHFTPLTKEQMSLRNGVLFEYLLTKAIVTEAFDQIATGKTPLLKRNSSLRWYRNLYNVHLNALANVEDSPRARLAVWPAIYPFKEPVSFQNQEPLPLLYRCYNPLGSVIIRMIIFPFRKLERGLSRMRACDELLQIVLNKRLGKDVSLQASAYGDEYIIDVDNKKIFSPGPDREIGTKDDIKLPINPELLDWRN